jgi:hypothetical protein
MPEPVDAWWERRRASTGRSVPYPLGSYGDEWARFPVLVKQYHPDLNRGIALSQVPLAADVWLLWECDAGHRFIATPEEQRMRPGRERRRSTWCPTCSDLARGRTPRPLPMPGRRRGRPAARAGSAAEARGIRPDALPRHPRPPRRRAVRQRVRAGAGIRR